MKFPYLLFAFLLLVPGYGQNYPSLENVLTRELPADSKKDGRWVFYPEKADIQKIENPLVQALLPHYTFYQVTLTNYLGYHINQGTCVILFDSLNSKIILVQPLWYGGVSPSLVKLFLHRKFETREKLLGFLRELHELMEIGSGYRFVFTGSADELITYDLVYDRGDTYTTGGNGTSSTVTYTREGIWRKIEVRVRDEKIMEYTSINPALEGRKEYENEYKETIR